MLSCCRNICTMVQKAYLSKAYLSERTVPDFFCKTVECQFIGFLLFEGRCMCSWQFTASRTISSSSGTTRNEKTLFHGTGKHAPEKIVLQREGFMLDYGWYSNVHLVILQSLFVFASTKLSLPPCPIPFPHAYTVFAFSWPRIRAVHLLIFCRSWECVTMSGFLCSSFLPPPLYVVPLLRFPAVFLACFLATLLVILHFYLLLAQHAHCHDHRKYQLIYGPYNVQWSINQVPHTFV